MNRLTTDRQAVLFYRVYDYLLSVMTENQDDLQATDLSGQRYQGICQEPDHQGNSYTVKFLNFGMPKNIAVIYFKLKRRGQTLGYFVKMMQME